MKKGLLIVAAALVGLLPADGVGNFVDKFLELFVATAFHHLVAKCDGRANSSGIGVDSLIQLLGPQPDLHFTKGIAREVIDFGITVNCVAPVMTETDLLTGMDEAYIADRKSRIPMGRFCSVPEIADMVAWAASPRCSFTTGQCFDVTGGRATY